MAKTTFDHIASTQTYTVAATGVLKVTMWGAGGGSGRYSSGSGNTSGAGGALYFVAALTAGDVLTFEVGGGGKPGLAAVAAGGKGGWPDGGFGSLGDTRPSGGGGSTRAYLNGVLIAVAGAGGGSGGYSGHAGGGGYPNGQDASIAGGGSGGTQTAGGFDKDAPSVVAKQGGYLRGGRGGNVADETVSTSDDGGGGGGGYYGGGGGGGDGQSAGGGSSWVDQANPVITGFSFGNANWEVPPFTSDAAYKAGVAVGRQRNLDLAGGDGYVVVETDLVASPVQVSKLSASAILRNYNKQQLSKAAAFVALRNVTQAVSKTALFVVLKEAPPDPYDLEVRVSKASGFAVLKPGTNGPLTFVTSAAADILTQRNDRLRVTERSVEAVHNSKAPNARTSSRLGEALLNATAGARIGTLSIEVLRSTAEVTVQALVTADVVDVVYDRFGRARTTTIYAEVLMAAGVDGEDYGVVSVVN